MPHQATCIGISVPMWRALLALSEGNIDLVSNVGRVLTKLSNEVSPKTGTKKVPWKVFTNIWLEQLNRTEVSFQPYDLPQKEEKEIKPILGRDTQLQRHKKDEIQMFSLAWLVCTEIRVQCFCWNWKASFLHKTYLETEGFRCPWFREFKACDWVITTATKNYPWQQIQLTKRKCCDSR